MKRRPLFWHLFPAILCIVLITLSAVTWFAARSFREFHYDRTRSSLESISRITSLHIKAYLADLQTVEVSDVCRSIGEATGTRLTVVSPTGHVIADTDHSASNMDNHSDRPEIRQAWKAGVGSRIRLSGTLQEEMMYVATLVRIDNKAVAVIRVARALNDINQAVGLLTKRMLLFGLGVVALGALLAMFITRRITFTLNHIKAGSKAYAAGDFSHHLPSSNVAEIDVLTSTLNRMAEELHDRIATITRQRDEQNALLSCMTEAVLAVDTERRLIKVNASARELLQIPEIAPGKTPIAELIRNADLLNIIEDALEADEPVGGEILIPEREQHLFAHGTALTDSENRHIGAVLVINDVTRLRRLATMRRDFVANVSHELKTPITSIKGFAETLLEETVDPDSNEARFLGIICKQSDRLQSIVEDLLALADIEDSTEKKSIEFHTVPIARVLENAVGVCLSAATAHNIKLAVDCNSSLETMANIQLFEQAITNLVGNAVKYGLADTTVFVSARVVEDCVEVSVRDQGPGIASKHLSRLFERFYRVDKSRSRKLGGTGLGLAIVKRIALAHAGHVHVESELGKGSTFFMSIPYDPSKQVSASAGRGDL
jgi:two-component system phosphate regulon sensor histidine kinase PhoR